jgi:hypothetical protein
MGTRLCLPVGIYVVVVVMISLLYYSNVGVCSIMRHGTVTKLSYWAEADSMTSAAQQALKCFDGTIFQHDTLLSRLQ